MYVMMSYIDYFAFLSVIVGAAELECESVDEIMSCLEQGAIYRHTGSTAMNDVSSRSHSVFTILIGERRETFKVFLFFN